MRKGAALMRGVHPLERMAMRDVARHALCMWPPGWTPPGWLARLVTWGWIGPSADIDRSGKEWQASGCAGTYDPQIYVHMSVTERGERALRLDALIRGGHGVSL